MPRRWARAAREILENLGPLLAFSVVFRGIATLALAPAATFLVHRLLRASGRTSVENTDLVGFVLSPLGLATLLVALALTIALRIVEGAGFLHLHVRRRAGLRTGLLASLRAALAAAPRALSLALRQAVRAAVVAAPFVAALGGVHHLLLTEKDVNAYLHERPTELWVALALGALIALAGALALVRLLLRWSLAVPLLLQEDLSAREALLESARRVRGATGRAAALFLGWEALVLAAFGALSWLYFAGAREVLDRVPHTTSALLWTLALLLAGRILLTAAEAFVATSGDASLALDLYEERGGRAALRTEGVELPPRAAASRWWRLAGVAALAAAAASATLALDRAAGSRRRVEIHAHRGASKAAPENTMAAVRAAIDARADYAEVDVLRTADGVAVLGHDADLVRTAGVALRVEASTWDEIKGVDVGRRFSPAFAGETPARLADVLDAAKGRIGLQLELKFYGEDRRLAAEVARLVGEKGMEDQVLVSSLVVPSLRLAKEANPRVRTAAIVTTAVGDVTALDVDALSLGGRLATPRRIRAAQRRGMRVLVWTVDDERAISDWIDRGVDGIVTNEPALAARVRAEREGLAPPERVLLAARALFGR